MGGIEVPKVYRSLDHDGWSEQAEAAAGSIFGEGVLDFHDPAVEGHPLFLLEEAELILAAQRYPSAEIMGKLLTMNLVEKTRGNMPPVFSEPAGSRDVKKLNLLQLPEPEGVKRIIIASVEPNEQFMLERMRAQAAINKALDATLPWKPRFLPGIRLARVVTDDFIQPESLRQLRRHLPNEVYIGEGHIDPATFEIPRQ